MTTLHGNTDSQQPRYDAQSAFQAADHLEKQAEQLESGIPQDDHDEVCRDIQQAGGDEPVEIETMADSDCKVELHLDKSLVQRAMRAFLEFTFPDSPKKSKYDSLDLKSQFAVNEILEAYETALKAGRKATIAGFVRGVDDAIRDALIEELEAIAEYYGLMTDPILKDDEINRCDLFRKIKRTSCTKAVKENRHCKRSWAVVVHRRSKLFGVIRMPYNVASLQTELDANHPDIDFKLMQTVDADNEAARRNESILRVSRCPKRWHVVAVSTS